MENTFLLILGLVVAFIIGLFSSRKTTQEDGKVLDLTSKINDNKQKSVQAQALADKAVKEYEDAKKKYDPNFDDDKPSA